MKNIIVDIDEVCLCWLQSFAEFLYKYYDEKYHDLDINKIGDWSLTTWLNCDNDTLMGYIYKFNTSEQFAMLSPTPYSIKALTELKNNGYNITALSCCTTPGEDSLSEMLRNINLKYVFGENMFNEIICLPLRSSKDEILKSLPMSYYIEDNYEYAKNSLKFNHVPIVIEYSYNKKFKHQDSNIMFVKNWEDIITIILGK